MYQVAERMIRIWHVAMAYQCPIGIEGIVYVATKGILDLIRPLEAGWAV
jgi:hypothetical protein